MIRNVSFWSNYKKLLGNGFFIESNMRRTLASAESPLVGPQIKGWILLTSGVNLQKDPRPLEMVKHKSFCSFGSFWYLNLKLKIFVNLVLLTKRTEGFRLFLLISIDLGLRLFPCGRATSHRWKSGSAALRWRWQHTRSFL